MIARRRVVARDLGDTSVAPDRRTPPGRLTAEERALWERDGWREDDPTPGEIAEMARAIRAAREGGDRGMTPRPAGERVPRVAKVWLPAGAVEALAAWPMGARRNS